MKKLFPLFVLLALPLWPLNEAHADVDPAIIPTDARWVVYADLNALRASVLGKEIVAMAEKAQFDTGQGKIGLDVPKLLATVGTATAFGANFSHDPKAIDGTLVLQGTPDLRKIAEALLLQATITTPEGVAELKDLPFPAYAITPKGPKDGPKAEVIVAFPPEPIVLVSKSREQLVKARDVFRGAAPSLAGASDSPLQDLLHNSSHAYLFVASVVPSETLFPEGQPQARILQMTHSGAIAIGENGPNTFAHVDLLATSDEMADKLMKILQGMTAMMSLAETNDKQLAEFLNSAAVSRDNDTVTLNLAYSSERLVQMIRTVQQKQQQTPEERAAARIAQIASGEVIAKWQAEAVTPVEGAGPVPLAWHTIENVALKNGTIITLGHQNNGGKNVRFDHVEITPAGEKGPSLTFRLEFMRLWGPRNSLAQFQFPGADGTYTLKVAYVNDPAGKAAYVVSIRNPKPPSTESKPE
ncbi:MAG TPA: hypothetical protein VMI53_02145 [Opitutaceae bacterium]|nr:hypothetical protein [Opitutaceae bacterium]